MSRDVFNLEQIEVFMGPTGSDVGRGNAAGYVNMQTKAPHEDSAYAVTYGYGSGDLNRTTVDLNQDLALGAPDSWLGRSAVRLNALWEDGGVAGRDIVTRKNQSIAPSIALGLNTADARHWRRADHATGQRAGLRDSRLRMVRDRACADDGHRDAAGRFTRISTAASAMTSTRWSRRAIPDASSTTSTATMTLQESDALQRDASHGRDYGDPVPRELLCPRRRWSRLRARATNARTRSCRIRRASRRRFLTGRHAPRGDDAASRLPPKSSSRRR